VTFFPQLVAGPILRAREVIPQLQRRPEFQVSDACVGIKRILFGLFLKVVLADNIAPLVDSGFAQSVHTLAALDVWTLAFLFGFQIYFDFSAYSHIAIGSALLMGIRFPENFNFPYMALSPRDFWHRWHISLSSWVRDYLYLPLAGIAVRDTSVGGLEVASADLSKKSATFALFVAWTLMGLWHGASWTFVVWGVYHATLVYLGRMKVPLMESAPLWFRDLIGWTVTLPLVMLGWVFFRAQDLSSALGMVYTVLQPAQYLTLGLRETTYVVAAVLMIGIVLAYAIRCLHEATEKRHRMAWTAAESAVLAGVTAIVYIYLRPVSQFIYFQF
jgi:alginate O-acetyltransferase complex protein AlgI